MTKAALLLSAGVCALGVLRASPAQTIATVDAGFSLVRYDGFLTSTAASLTPALRWERTTARSHAHVSARGTYLRFESGNRSLEGLVRGAWFAHVSPHWRAEVAAAFGASDYADIASFAHGLLEGRLHRVNERQGAWVGVAAGRSSFGGVRRPVAVAAAGVWALRADLTILATADRSFVGDTAYTDLRTTTRLRRGSLLVEASVGARVWSRGGGRGIYGEGSATWELGRRLALVVSAGRYPTDAVSGSIAGRYVSAALRVATAPSRRPVARVSRSTGSADPPSAARLEILPAGTVVRLVVYAPGAARVEIAGDFTEWRPLALRRTPAGSWEAHVRLARGVHRIDVRIDGGPWIAPAGTTRLADDYGGEVGLFVVP
ncbi:MAG: glycogen-binding domain-containing protein [Gemmatimonadales bacterium]